VRYQLVLQWPSTVTDYETLVSVEESLADAPSRKYEVDGHDWGSREVNIFLRTGEPEGAFEQVKNTLVERDALRGLRAAYRSTEGSTYMILWPTDLQAFEVL